VNDAGSRKPAAPLRLILLYKLVKATLALGFAVVLWGLVLEGETDRLGNVVEQVRHHLTAAWTLELVDALVSAADRHHVVFAASALTLDGAFTLFEWYALHTGHPWGEWLVVLATSSLLPFEVVAIVRHKRAGRIALLFVNLAIVLYLGRRALEKHRAGTRRPPAASGPT
jgi:uncharacterized membrane protein (DUF2068 family)